LTAQGKQRNGHTTVALSGSGSQPEWCSGGWERQEQHHLTMESLILAQDERWRRA
jgi:hypothetical protein